MHDSLDLCHERARRGLLARCLVLLLSWPTFTAAAQEPSAAKARQALSPASWGDDGLAAARAADHANAPPVLAEGRGGIVATTSFPGTSLRVGMDVLAAGGSATDAALAVALVQNVINLGSWTSFAGTLSFVGYDAATQQVYTLEGGWNTVLAEADPASIPSRDSQREIGRKVLVPGFMAALEAAHDRFGKLPFEALFEPALYFARDGFELGEIHGHLLGNRQEILTRLPSGRAIFTKEDGSMYGPGDHFRQLALARTLEGVARDGSSFMYRGPWAEQLVATLSEHGGKMTMRDLRSYRASWREPTRGSFGEYEIAGLGLPGRGGVDAVEAFRLLEGAELDPSQHYSQDAGQLLRVLRAARAAHLFPAVEELFGDLDLSNYARTKPETSKAIWRRMNAAGWTADLEAALEKRRLAQKQRHSDAIVAADAQGNVVAVLHTINTVLWGNTGLFVGGVSLADVAAIQRGRLAPFVGGRRVHDFGHPYLVLRGGKPVVASASVGRALHEVAFQNVLNLIVYDLDPRASLAMPQFLVPHFERGTQGALWQTAKQSVVDGDFSSDVLNELSELGQEVVLKDPTDQSGVGYWVGLRIDPSTGRMQASASQGGGAAAVQ